jgi:hydroxymethylpyrimidine pyrophosphatase-like HAD family hydrolase
MLLSFYEDLKGYHQISKENYDKIAELYDNHHKVFVETGRKIKKLIK